MARTRSCPWLCNPMAGVLRLPVESGDSIAAWRPLIPLNRGTPVASTSMAPILKWPGGKRALAQTIARFVPGKYGTYYEPFCGGAALFLALDPPRAVLGDTNAELIECYQTLAKDPDAVISELAMMRNDARSYFSVRASRPASPAGRAARLIYLCRLSFNGIYRVNKAGEFNVPYGRRDHRSVCEPEHLRAVALRLARADLQCGDFQTTVETVQAGDVVYFDPPYTLAHGSNGFIKYNSQLFAWSDQERLARVAADLADRGAMVLVSNADHRDVRALYPGFVCHVIHRHSVIAATTAARRLVTEVLMIAGEGISKCG